MTKGKWDIKELKTFFRKVELPSEPIRLDGCTLITDVSLFVLSHLSYVKAHNGNESYLPYFDRLKELKRILSTK